MSDKQKFCVVCGARAYINSTCDRICGDAKRAGRTRAEQIAEDLKKPGPWDDSSLNYCHICGSNYHGDTCQVCEGMA